MTSQFHGLRSTALFVASRVLEDLTDDVMWGYGALPFGSTWTDEDYNTMRQEIVAISKDLLAKSHREHLLWQETMTTQQKEE